MERRVGHATTADDILWAVDGVELEVDASARRPKFDAPKDAQAQVSLRSFAGRALTRGCQISRRVFPGRGNPTRKAFSLKRREVKF